jgi:hypothetical protein
MRTNLRIEEISIVAFVRVAFVRVAFVRIAFTPGLPHISDIYHKSRVIAVPLNRVREGIN